MTQETDADIIRKRMRIKRRVWLSLTSRLYLSGSRELLFKNGNIHKNSGVRFFIACVQTQTITRRLQKAGFYNGPTH